MECIQYHMLPRTIRGGVKRRVWMDSKRRERTREVYACSLFQAEAGWRHGFTFFPLIVLLRHPGSSPHFSYQRVHMKPNSTVSSTGQIQQETSVGILTARHVEVEHNIRLINRGRGHQHHLCLLRGPLIQHAVTPRAV